MICLGMEITKIEIAEIDRDFNTNLHIGVYVTFKHGDNLEFENDGKVFHVEEDEGVKFYDIECEELDNEFFEVAESEIVEAWEEEAEPEKTFFGPFSTTKHYW